MNAPAQKPFRVLYILEIFPEISETFILFGMMGARRQGVDIRVVSLTNPKPGENHRESEEFLPVTLYLKNVPLCKQYAALIRILISHPAKLVKFARYLYGIEKYIRDTRNRLLQVCYLSVKARQERTDHIHAHFANLATSFAMWVHMLTDIPFTFSSHGYDIFYVFPKDMRLKTDLAKKHITVSRQSAAYIQEKIGNCTGKLVPLYSGIDTDFFSFNPDQNRDNILLHVARLHPVKGQQYLIRACRLLKDRGLDFQCLIIGEGEERAKLEQLIADLKLKDTCLLPGSKTREELVPYYQRAKVFVLTSVSEGLGNVLKEALACGVPAVGPRVGGIPEIIVDGKTGYLFEAGNVEEIADKILSLWNDPRQRAEFAQNGRKFIEENFDYRRQSEKMVAIWKEE